MREEQLLNREEKGLTLSSDSLIQQQWQDKKKNKKLIFGSFDNSEKRHERFFLDITKLSFSWKGNVFQDWKEMLLNCYMLSNRSPLRPSSFSMRVKLIITDSFSI